MLLRLVDQSSERAVEAFLEGRGTGHLDLPRLISGGFVGGLFAVFVPSPSSAMRGPKRTTKGYDTPAPPAMSQGEVLPSALAMTGLLHRLAEQSGGRFRVCTTVAQIQAARRDNAVAAVLHYEGAEAIDTECHTLDALYAAGLRSLGLVWSRPTAFGHGVPFRFPGSPDIGPGLTSAGRYLVRACNERGIAVDLSHLNAQGFWDVAGLSTAPLVASHSNAHALCPHTRNLTDDQLRAVRDSGGVVGLNFGTYFLRPDGGTSADTPVSVMVDHIDHMIDIMGDAHVGLGSDFDGIQASPIRDGADMQTLVAALRERGHDESRIARLTCDNWLRVLAQTWGE
ncbi:membrane dipeptidase [Salinisphaera sp. Q1T1-3]|nr:membrane dipeptidase [Salinisphaera sp. Q1T1-3]